MSKIKVEDYLSEEGCPHCLKIEGYYIEPDGIMRCHNCDEDLHDIPFQPKKEKKKINKKKPKNEDWE